MEHTDDGRISGCRRFKAWRQDVILDRLNTLITPDNPMFSGPRQAARLPGWILSGLIHIAVIVVGLGLVSLALIGIYGDLLVVEEILLSDFGRIVPFALMLAVLWVWVIAFEKRPFRSIGFFTRNAVWKYLTGFAVGVLMLSVAVGLMLVTDCVRIKSGSVSTADSTGLWAALVVLFGFLVQGGTEEVISRGWYLGVLGARYRPWVGVIVSSLLFALLHLTLNPVAILNLALFGFFLALYCLREGSIWGACGWHAAWNWGQAYLYGMDVSGHTLSTGALIDFEPTGAPLLNGGSYGPEGSLYVTVSFLLGIAVILMLTDRHRRLT